MAGLLGRLDFFVSGATLGFWLRQTSLGEKNPSVAYSGTQPLRRFI